MGARKRLRAEQTKELKKTQYLAKLNNCPTSPRKMRMLADTIRGAEVTKAAALLQFSKKAASTNLEKLLWSAIHNYEQKSGNAWEDANLFVKEIFVDEGKALKRIQPAPQGRAHRLKKRSNHVTIILDTINSEATN